MNATIPMLLVSTVAMSVAPTAQTTRQQGTSEGVPVDVSVEGLAPGGRGSRTGLSARTSTPLDCTQRIADQADPGGCLLASSAPTLGMLYPYPGLNNVQVPLAFVGGGEDNLASQACSVVGGGKGNVASGIAQGHFFYYGYATVGGGRSNQAIGPYSTVAGGIRNNAFGVYSNIGGGRRNQATGEWSTVGGGYTNSATNYYTTVAGGRGNSARGTAATVGGGSDNSARGTAATVGGGDRNSGYGDYGTVGGGVFNTASGRFSTVVGGRVNAASGHHATAAGGRSNTATGDYSFAAGRRARANHDGAFVWGDSQDLDKPSSLADEFNVYASGGVRMFTNSAATTGVLLAAGGSTWTMVSDRDAKDNLEPVDARDVLDKVAQLPVATWNYKSQDDSIRHMGPMAQDFFAAFGLGLGEKTIDTIDPNGVALAAIQGLNELVQDETADLKAQLAEKGAEIEDLRAQVEALTRQVEDLASGR